MLSHTVTGSEHFARQHGAFSHRQTFKLIVSIMEKILNDTIMMCSYEDKLNRKTVFNYGCRLWLKIVRSLVNKQQSFIFMW